MPGRVHTGLSPIVARRNGLGQERRTWRVPALPMADIERTGRMTREAALTPRGRGRRFAFGRVEVAGENGPTGIGIYIYIISVYWRGTCAPGVCCARAPGNARAGPTRLTGSIIAMDPNIERQRSSWTPEEGKGQISSTRRAYLTKPTVTWFTDPRGLKRKPCSSDSRRVS